MVGDPVPGDVGTAANPHVLEAEDIVEKTLQSNEPAGMTGEARMQADGHHARDARALAVIDVERVPEIGEEIGGSAKTGRRRELGVVVGEGVRDDEVGFAANRRPVGKIVGIGIGVVEEAAFLDEEAAGVSARRIAAIPADRPLADRRGE